MRLTPRLLASAVENQLLLPVYTVVLLHVWMVLALTIPP
jgi:hypothetical protein